MPLSKIRKKLWEPTELQCYTECSQKWVLRYREQNEPETRSLPMVRGTIGHEILHRGMDFADEIFYMVVRHGDKPIIARPEDIDKAKADIFEMCENYFRWAEAEPVEYIAKEKTLNWHFVTARATKRRYYFIGTVDAIVRLPETPKGMIDVFDYKFGRLHPVESRNRNMQFGSYYFGLRANKFKPFRFIWVQMADFQKYKRKGKYGDVGDLKGPGLYPIRITPKDIPYIGSMTSRILHAAMTNQTYPSPYGIGASPCSYCDFKNTLCPQFQTGVESREGDDML